jgi:hypothetical protein
MPVPNLARARRQSPLFVTSDGHGGPCLLVFNATKSIACGVDVR